MFGRATITLGIGPHSSWCCCQLISEADESFLKRIITYDGHILQPLLPDRRAIPYSLRERTHNKTLISRTTHFTDDDSIIRMLYKEHFINIFIFCSITCPSCVGQVCNKRICVMCDVICFVRTPTQRQPVSRTISHWSTRARRSRQQIHCVGHRTTN